MSNPVFNRNPMFGTPRGGPAATVPVGYGSAGYTAAAAPQVGALEQMYSAPTATTRDTGRLTYDDVIVKTAGLLALLVVVAAVTWYTAPELFWVGMIVGLVLGLVNAFKRNPSPVLIVAYVIAEGVFLGGISYLFQNYALGGEPAEPIVVQAVLGTFATFFAALLLFTSGKVRVTAKFTRWLMVAIGGYAIFSLVNLVLLWTGVLDEWGMRSGPLGVVISVVAIGLAALALIVDFDAIKRGVQQGAPAKFAWTAAFGLIVTLVWLYLEFLRLLAILRN